MKDEKVDFDPQNMWHIEAFITSLRFHNKVHENDDAEGNKRRIAFEVEYFNEPISYGPIDAYIVCYTNHISLLMYQLAHEQ